MTILQITYNNHKLSLQFGTVKDRDGMLECVTRVGRYGYHPSIPDNTRQHYGQFKLEII